MLMVAFLLRYVDEGYDVVSTVASCTLMIKQEWPLILPNDEVHVMVVLAVMLMVVMVVAMLTNNAERQKSCKTDV